MAIRQLISYWLRSWSIRLQCSLRWQIKQTHNLRGIYFHLDFLMIEVYRDESALVPEVEHYLLLRLCAYILAELCIRGLFLAHHICCIYNFRGFSNNSLKNTINCKDRSKKEISNFRMNLLLPQHCFHFLYSFASEESYSSTDSYILR